MSRSFAEAALIDLHSHNTRCGHTDDSLSAMALAGRVRRDVKSGMASTASLAVFSDAHGNSLALEAVLKDIHRHAPDLVLNLGDQIWGQVDPLGAYDLQSELNAVEVRGNNDEKPLLARSGLSDFEQGYAQWLSKRVPAEAFERLAALPVNASVLDGQVLAAHGTPASPWDLLLWKVEAGQLVPRSDEEIAGRLQTVAEDVELVVVGHTHRERSVQLGGRLLVNVGPVAWQRDGDPRARWTLLTRDETGWTAHNRRVDYDWQEAAAAVIRNEPFFRAEVDSHLQGVSQRPAHA